MKQRTYEKKASTKNSILRLIFVGLALILEIFVILGIFLTHLKDYIQILSFLNRLIALVLVLAIYSQNKSPSIKMPWITLMLVAPTIGITLYLLIGFSGSTKMMRKRYEVMDELMFPYLHQNDEIMTEIKELDDSCFGVSNYLLKQSRYPVYSGVEVKYYDDASKGIEAQKKDLMKAKEFIFMEYFAIEDKESWQAVEEILVKKVKEGVEVRVFYDDIGSIGYISGEFIKKLQSKGIKCRVFNPVMPIFNLFFNHRDHRKMTIIDGEIGYTGGYNIANEYFNITSPYGHWKDTGIRLKGETVKAMTATFLEMWNAVRSDDKDDGPYIRKYFARDYLKYCEKGFVQFYADNPMDKKPVGEEVYMNMASRAKDYLYFCSPYLIITDEMSRVLCLAAKRGVDVRIITPGIPDKKIVFKLTRSYYNQLTLSGVRIYEYTPGFCHAKMSISDDIIATCGTINLDYRSLYHHFEDGCLLIGCEAIGKIKKDFEETFTECKEVTAEYRDGRSAPLRFGQMILRLVAPLL